MWGNSRSSVFDKFVTVVEEDIDIRDREAIEWAIAYRVDAGEGQLVTYGPTPGSVIDPSNAQEYQNPKKYGASCWTRVLIDATRSWKFDPNPHWGGRRFAPVGVMPPDLDERLSERWPEYGISDHYLNDQQREKLTYREMAKEYPEWSPFTDPGDN